MKRNLKLQVTFLERELVTVTVTKKSNDYQQPVTCNEVTHSTGSGTRSESVLSILLSCYLWGS